jgi:hypothetical protein
MLAFLPRIEAMIRFEHEPMMRPVLTGATATIQCTGEKESCNKTLKLFKKMAICPDGRPLLAATQRPLEGYLIRTRKGIPHLLRCLVKAFCLCTVESK